MSKRYGRNQKRKARELIADLQEEQEVFANYMRQQSEKIYRLDMVIDRAADIAGEMSVLFPAKDIASPDKAMPTWEVVRKNSSHPCFSSILGMRKPDYQAQRLHVMLGRIDKNELEVSTHCMIQFADMRWGYAISNSALHATPAEHLSKMISERLGKIIALDLKKAETK